MLIDNEVYLMKAAKLYSETYSQYLAKQVSKEFYFYIIGYINELGFTTTKLIEYENSNK